MWENELASAIVSTIGLGLEAVHDHLSCAASLRFAKQSNHITLRYLLLTQSNIAETFVSCLFDRVLRAAAFSFFAR